MRVRGAGWGRRAAGAVERRGASAAGVWRGGKGAPGGEASRPPLGVTMGPLCRRWLPGASAAAGGVCLLYRPCRGAVPPPLPVSAAAGPGPLPRPARQPPSYGGLEPPAVATTEARALATPFSFLVSALEAGSWPGRGPPSALHPSRGGWPQPRGDSRALS